MDVLAYLKYLLIFTMEIVKIVYTMNSICPVYFNKRSK